MAREIERLFPAGGFGFAVISASKEADSSLGQQREQQPPILLYNLVDRKRVRRDEESR
jgi:hypothetical protein